MMIENAEQWGKFGLSVLRCMKTGGNSYWDTVRMSGGPANIVDELVKNGENPVTIMKIGILIAEAGFSAMLEE